MLERITQITEVADNLISLGTDKKTVRDKAASTGLSSDIDKWMSYNQSFALLVSKCLSEEIVITPDFIKRKRKEILREIGFEGKNETVNIINRILPQTIRDFDSEKLKSILNDSDCRKYLRYQPNINTSILLLSKELALWSSIPYQLCCEFGEFEDRGRYYYLIKDSVKRLGLVPASLYSIPKLFKSRFRAIFNLVSGQTGIVDTSFVIDGCEAIVWSVPINQIGRLAARLGRQESISFLLWALTGQVQIFTVTHGATKVVLLLEYGVTLRLLYLPDSEPITEEIYEKIKKAVANKIGVVRESFDVIQMNELGMYHF